MFANKVAVNLGDGGARPGRARIETKTYLNAKRDNLQLAVDTDTRLLWVFCEGAARELTSIPLELCEVIAPLAEDAERMFDELPFARSVPDPKAAKGKPALAKA
jgi:hypothetical protein